MNALSVLNSYIYIKKIISGVHKVNFLRFEQLFCPEDHHYGTEAYYGTIKTLPLVIEVQPGVIEVNCVCSLGSDKVLPWSPVVYPGVLESYLGVLE